ncbi:MAG TPA: CatB-related O-acetyltransferase [Thermoplasmata archaeon]|nr:CatB-related O-acetyltransferase [Thermoplasmata archaeon]
MKGNIVIEDDVLIDENSVLNGHITISRGSSLFKNNELIGNIKIGRYCSIARNVTFQARYHSASKAAIGGFIYRRLMSEKYRFISKGPIIVGNDVWIGTRAIILSGVKIGDGAIVGAGAVVTKDVQPYEIVAGVPAKHIKWRFPEHIRKQLLEIKWWDWDDEKIKKNKKFFTTDLSKVEDVYELIVD